MCCYASYCGKLVRTTRPLGLRWVCVGVSVDFEAASASFCGNSVVLGDCWLFTRSVDGPRTAGLPAEMALWSLAGALPVQWPLHDVPRPRRGPRAAWGSHHYTPIDSRADYDRRARRGQHFGGTAHWRSGRRRRHGRRRVGRAAPPAAAAHHPPRPGQPRQLYFYSTAARAPSRR